MCITKLHAQITQIFYCPLECSHDVILTITCLASRDCSFRFVCTKVHCALNEVQRHVVEDTNCMLNSSNFISSMSLTPFDPDVSN